VRGWGSGAGDGTANTVVGEQKSRIFGELNVDDGCGPSFRSAAKKSCNSGGTKQRGGSVRNGTLILIEREDDTRSWGNFLIYFSHFITMSYAPRGWRYILIGC
jgi:hypothetical protein